ncbi:MAG TPA: hypothetical protein PK970_08740, partial [Hyphomicrobiaceae bacterium]|nr:hypothetical protein [Hyphomicrobiaceae bacterium]
IVQGGAGGTAEGEGGAAATAQPPDNEVPQAAVQPATPALVPPVPVEAVPRPALPRQPGAGAPKSSTGVRPLTDEERRRIFNGSGG